MLNNSMYDKDRKFYDICDKCHNKVICKYSKSFLKIRKNILKLLDDSTDETEKELFYNVNLKCLYYNLDASKLIETDNE